MLSPIEFNGMIQRTQDISVMKQNEDIKPQFEQMAVQVRQQQKAEEKHTNVNAKDNADRENTKYDAKEKGNGLYYKSQEWKKSKENNEKSDGTVRKISTSSFDIKA